MAERVYVLLMESTLGGCGVRLLFFERGKCQNLAQRINPHFSSQRLAVDIKHLLLEGGVDFSQISYVMVSCGPGSFTGIKVGMAFLQGLWGAAKLRACYGPGPQRSHFPLWRGVSSLAMILLALKKPQKTHSTDQRLAVGFLQRRHLHGFVAWQSLSGEDPGRAHSKMRLSSGDWLMSSAWSVGDVHHPAYGVDGFYLVASEIPQDIFRCFEKPISVSLLGEEEALSSSLAGMEQLIMDEGFGVEFEDHWKKEPPAGAYLKGHYAERGL